MLNMYEEYLAHYTKYTEQYKTKVAIFLMVGIFYEMYDIRDPETGSCKTSFLELVDLLALKVTVKKNECFGGADGLVAGIPVDMVHKWAGRLTSLGWTVVIIDQIKNTADKVIDRKVSRILTPGSHIEVATSADLFLTFVSLKKSLEGPPFIAISAIDLTTGHLHIFETQAQGSQSAWTSNEVIQFMELYSPREVLWSVEGPAHFCDSISEEKLRQILGSQRTTTFHKRTPLNSGAWTIQVYKDDYLRKMCKLKSLLPTYVALHLSPGSHSEMALISLLYALEELWPSMNLGTLMVYPWIPQTSLRLGENALMQLHMIVPNDSSKQDVLSLFDKCSTPMGYRGIRERLLKPSAELSRIQQHLENVDAWSKKPIEYRLSVMKRFRVMSDLHRLYRKLQQGTLTSIDIIGLDATFKSAQWIFKSECMPTESIQDIETILKKVFDVFSLEKARISSEDTSFFLQGLSDELDSLEIQIQEKHDKIHQWISDRAMKLSVSTDIFKPEFKEKTFIIKAPKAILQTLKSSGNLPSDCTVVINKGSSYLESNELDTIFFSLMKLRESLAKRQMIVLIEQGGLLASELFTSWMNVTNHITDMDVNVTLARIALELGYTKPTLVDSDHAFVSIHGLRHPLLEIQDRKTVYVQHDIELDTQGWLLYGLNASGKSSLMRSTGLAVLLAQAGSFVPATSMTLSPFTSLHTRIINTDNLWMGLSSFAVEMSEMRDIFREAGPRSLVLGDELCSGTETTSATALVAAGLRGLLKRGAKFLFATHLHGLSQIKDIDTDTRLRIRHLHVEYDKINDKLIYHRTLRDGPGSSLYGIEVAKAMRLPDDILEDAIRYRKEIAGEANLIESVGSSWNPSVIRKECENCGCKFVPRLEVHHLNERHTAVNDHLSDGSNVHSLANLAVLCDTCHDAIHSGQLFLQPFEMTSDGPERRSSASVITTSSSKKSKWTMEEESLIQKTCLKYVNQTNSQISRILLTDYSIQISSASLRKFRS